MSDITPRLSAIAQWLQREDDELLYAPDGAAHWAHDVHEISGIRVYIDGAERPDVTLKSDGSLTVPVAHDALVVRWSGNIYINNPVAYEVCLTELL